MDVDSKRKRIDKAKCPRAWERVVSLPIFVLCSNCSTRESHLALWRKSMASTPSLRNFPSPANLPYHHVVARQLTVPTVFQLPLPTVRRPSADIRPWSKSGPAFRHGHSAFSPGAVRCCQPCSWPSVLESACSPSPPGGLEGRALRYGLSSACRLGHVGRDLRLAAAEPGAGLDCDCEGEQSDESRRQKI